LIRKKMEMKRKRGQNLSMMQKVERFVRNKAVLVSRHQQRLPCHPELPSPLIRARKLLPCTGGTMAATSYNRLLDRLDVQFRCCIW
jgi:hypothetical protein